MMQRRRNLVNSELSLRPWVLATFLLTAAMASSGQQDSDPMSTLRDTRARILGETERLPRYTCVQTITRRYYRSQPQVRKTPCWELIAAHENRGHELPLEGWDRLRLEVATADGQNIYSWAGAPKFEEGSFEKLAEGGPLGSGDFGPFLRSIFGVANTSFEKEEVIDGRRLFLYSYQVPPSRSRYQVKANQGWFVTGYSGTFLLDPHEPDIVNLTVRTAELPASTSSCQAISSVEYGRIPIHGRAILIPSETRLLTIDRTGNESLSSTTYDSCREFASQSRILLEEPSNSSAAVAGRSSPAPSRELPNGLHLQCRITTPLDSDTAAAGDPIEAVLRAPIRNKEHEVIAPAGALLHGRLLHVGHRRGQAQIAFRFETIEVPEGTVPFRAKVDSTWYPQSRYRVGAMFISPDQVSADISVITFHGERLRLHQLDWGWTTLPLDHKNGKTAPDSR